MYDYALLDNTDPNSQNYGCQSDNRGTYLPSGWTIAPNDNTTQGILGCHSWGATCIILNGTSLNPQTLQTCAPTLSTKSNSGAAPFCYSVSNCSTNARILIRRVSNSSYAPYPMW